MNIPIRSLLLLCVAGMLSACAQTDKKPLLSVDETLVIRGYQVVGPVNSIRNFRISGWSRVDDKFIIISAGIRDHYLVGLRNRCPETGSAMNIAFTNMAGSITKADKLIVKAPGGYTDTCFISTITQLEKVRKKPDED